ncbi:hypothetical protein DID88_004837 [Monilinia fructigena]|uniref:Protein kinase domain-containing protein n=1 Tax=Monilinia fructigena TaxID=38457 RepID=A0A395IPQ2_9HELO|nr:hypothetical protein DID88_004837 [Monilinia fructigena]
MPARPSLPRLQLATPMGSNATPYEQPGRGAVAPGQSASGGSESSAAHSRSGSFGPMDGKGSGPTSAGSQYSAFSLASQIWLEQTTRDPRPLGRTLDVEDLDDDGWRIASMEKRIEELGSLGEGAGGAVTRCMLKGGKTVFALKIITTKPRS